MYNKIKITLLLHIGLVLMLSGQTTIKAVTYNLEGMKPGTEWETRLDHIIDGLIALDPDIMGFQEVAQTSGSNNMAQTIADSLSNHFGVPYHVYWQSTHVAYSSYTEGLAIVTRLPVLATGYQNLPIAVFPRKVLWNRLATESGDIHFFTTHLAYRAEDNAFRVNQVNTIKNYINGKMNAFPAIGAILCGDFNCTPDSDPIAELVEYHSSWFTLHPTSAGFTYPATSPNKKIDYLFVHDSSLVTIGQCSLIMYSPYDGVNYPSDHWGIQATYQLPATSIHQDDNTIWQPRDFQLSVTPNPFNPQTKINYDLPHPASVTLTIYNLKGQPVRILVDENQSTGRYRYAWSAVSDSGQSPSTGIYVVRLRVDSQVRIVKMVYLK